MTGRATHGHTRGRQTTGTFRSWCAMLQRCYYPKSHKFPRYGGRGIIVCDRWRYSFENFLADMGERPEGLSLDRENNDGNYEPGNCRWATAAQQTANRDHTGLGWKRNNTHCPKGHPYSGDNLHLRVDRKTGKTIRRCRTCERQQAARRQPRRKATA